MQIIAIVNEKGGTGKTTTAVSLSAALAGMAKRVLLVDLDGQAASSRWLGVEEDSRLADALLRGGGLDPIADILPGLSLAPGSGKLDSVSHDLRPTQGGQLRRVLTELEGRYDYVLIDCPPSLGNRLIGNALLAATHAIAPVEPSILALDGLGILLTTLQDIRDGFNHEVDFLGALACRYDSRTRLSKLVLAELNRALPGKVFKTVIHETVRIQECPASRQTIFQYAPDCSAADDYREMARELMAMPVELAPDVVCDEDAVFEALSGKESLSLEEFRRKATQMFGARAKGASSEKAGEDNAAGDGQQDSKVADGPTVPLQVPVKCEEGTVETVKASNVDAPVSDDRSDRSEVSAEADAFNEVRASEVFFPEAWDGDPLGPTAEPGDDLALSEQETVDYLPSSMQRELLENDASRIEEDADQAESDLSEVPIEGSSARTVNRRLVAALAGVPAVLVLAGALVGWRILTVGDSGPEQAVAQDGPTATLLHVAPALRVDEPAGQEQLESELLEGCALLQADQDQGVETDEVLPDQLASLPVTSEPVEPEVAEVAEESVLEPATELKDQEAAGPDQPDAIEYIDCPVDYRLSCIMKSSNGYLAMVNGKCARVGQTIDGAEVMAIGATSVEMSIDGKRFVINMGRMHAATATPGTDEVE